MGKSVSGPEISDVTSLWWTIEQGQQCTITLLVELDGSVGGCGIYVHAVALSKRPVSLQDNALGAVTVSFPHRDTRTLEGCLFRLLYQLDSLIGAGEGLTKH